MVRNGAASPGEGGGGANWVGRMGGGGGSSILGDKFEGGWHLIEEPKCATVNRRSEQVEK